MKLICPVCRSACAAEAWAEDENIKSFMRSSAALPAGVIGCAWHYIGFFRPRSGRGLTWTRAAKLAAELAEMANGAHLSFSGRPARPNTPEFWAAAIEKMIARPPRELPLTNHNYLRKIAWDLADKADSAREAAQNRAIAAGRNVHRAAETVTAGDIVSPEEIRASIAAFRRKRGRKS
jgi:hypothetical protein